MYKAYKFRLYPNEKQTVLMHKTFGCYRFIYNYFLDICKKDGYKKAFDMIKKLPSLNKEYEWLINNSYKYGYILRYPEGKEKITGYMYEEWHYRYVGKETAKEVYESNLTYDEFIAKK